MEGILRDFMSSGKRLLTDTKQMKIKDPKKKKAAIDTPEADPHKNFIRRVCMEKPKKSEVVDDIKKFIAGAEAEL